jgi:hypothetical protein
VVFLLGQGSCSTEHWRWYPLGRIAQRQHMRDMHSIKLSQHGRRYCRLPGVSARGVDDERGWRREKRPLDEPLRPCHSDHHHTAAMSKMRRRG